MRRCLTTAVLAVAIAALGAPAASARDGFVESFDGTRIVYSFFPAANLKPGTRAPTVMFGPGYSQARDTDSESKSEEIFGSVGVGPLRAAGFNVLTWDPRGFGDSGGQVNADGPDFEARDVQALMDFIAKQPEAQLDAPGDPRLGMSGVSYGGGIQLVTSAIDRRIDAITPVIAWHSLVTSLYKNQTPKGGWGSVLFGAGLQGTTLGGIYGGTDPNGPQPPKSSNPHIQSAFTSGLATGTFPQSDVDWFASRGPGNELMNKITIPTLLIEGTADTLFTLPEAIRNYEILKRNGVPVKMLWFCGGHGVCLTNNGDDPLLIEKSVIAWLSRYLKRDTSVQTGAGFRWIADDGVLRSAPSYPLPQGTPLRAAGTGTLPLVPGDTSGNQIAAMPAANAVNVPFPKPTTDVDMLGEPTLGLSYSGTGSQAETSVYAQIVDDAKGLVLGNQATPFRVTLDGKSHDLTLPLEGVAIHAKQGSSYRLQIMGGTNTYFFQRAAGTITFSDIKVNVPTVGASAGSVLTSALATPRLRLAVSPTRVRTGRRTRFRFRVTSTSASGARVAVRRASVSFAGRRYRTSRRGYVVTTRRLRRSGRYRVRASRSGYRAAAAQVRAVPRRRAAPAFTG